MAEELQPDTSQISTSLDEKLDKAESLKEVRGILPCKDRALMDFDRLDTLIELHTDRTRLRGFVREYLEERTDAENEVSGIIAGVLKPLEEDLVTQGAKAADNIWQKYVAKHVDCIPPDKAKRMLEEVEDVLSSAIIDSYTRCACAEKSKKGSMATSSGPASSKKAPGAVVTVEEPPKKKKTKKAEEKVESGPDIGEPPADCKEAITQAKQHLEVLITQVRSGSAASVLRLAEGLPSFIAACATPESIQLAKEIADGVKDLSKRYYLKGEGQEVTRKADKLVKQLIGS